jgi:hypothetical protein
MITAFLYFLSSFLFFALFIFFIIDYENNRNKYVFYYALAFLIVYLFTFTLSVPVLVAPDNLTLLSYSYIATLFLVYCLILLCLKIQLLVTNNFYKKYFWLFNFIVVALGVTSLYFAINNLEDPTVTNIGVMINIDMTASWMTGILSVLYGLFWAYLFRKVAIELQDKILRRKMMMFSVNGILYGIGSFSLFTNQTNGGQFISIVFFSTSVISSAFVFLVPFLKNFFLKNPKIQIQ